MKNIFAKISTIALAGLMLASCDLNLFPEASIVYDPEKGFFTQEEDVLGARNLVYSNFRVTSGGFHAYLEDLMFDGFNATIEYGNHYGSIHRTDDSFTSSDQDIETFWGNYYLTIKNYNITIDAAETAPEELAESARFVKGEACAARAYAYLQLARHFGPKYDEATADTDLCVPLVLHYDQNARPARNTMSEVYGQILEDLDSAYVILTDYEVENAPNSLYFTPDAVKAMMARALLDTGDYQAAADSAIAVINSSAAYALSESESDLAKVRSEDAGSEAIMSLYASATEGPLSYSIFTSYGRDKTNSAGGGYSYNKPYFFPSQALLDLYETNDYRKIAWFTQSAKVPVNIKGSLYNNIFLFTKYAGNANYNTAGFANGLVASKPFLISEMYLIAAEGLYQAGDNTNAKKYLNILQAKRRASPTSVKEENIQKEWLRETVCEGLRMSCMKRWGSSFEGRAAQPNAANQNLIETNPSSSYEAKSMGPDDRAMCWPIPSYERKVNPNLEQNAGYGN